MTEPIKNRHIQSHFKHTGKHSLEGSQYPASVTKKRVIRYFKRASKRESLKFALLD